MTKLVLHLHAMERIVDIVLDLAKERAIDNPEYSERALSQQMAILTLENFFREWFREKKEEASKPDKSALESLNEGAKAEIRRIIEENLKND